MGTSRPLSLLLIFILQLLVPPTWASSEDELKKMLKNGGGLITNSDGEVIFKHRLDDPFIPASALKIATAAFTLYSLGENFRFETDFSLTSEEDLLIKGYGDPFLTSEELARAAQNIQGLGLKEVRHILLDTSYFSPDVKTIGADAALNPYNAMNGALIANFNTVLVKRLQDGSVGSAEEQTPLTPIAEARGKTLSPGHERRIHLGTDAKASALYVGELMRAFLLKQGIAVEGHVRVIGDETLKTKKIYSHRSVKKMSEILAGLLEYSTNFSSNQLLLVIGAKKQGAPATLDKGLASFKEFLQKQVGWQKVKIYDAAGLSRNNQATPLQMGQLLDYFKDYKELLPTKRAPFSAKTGTLTGVHTLAGYFPIEKDGRESWYHFVILINDQVSRNYRYEVAEKMLELVQVQAGNR